MAIFVRFSNGDLAHQMTLERKTARRIKVVVSSSIDKLVKEFLKYLYRCGNGAIPPISPKTTKNDQTLEPPGGRTVRLRYVGVSFTRHNFFHPSYNDVGPVYKFRIELRLDFAPFGSREKFERPSDRK